MAIEIAPFQSSSLEEDGFKTSPNTYVEHSELALGVTFPIKPDLVILDFGNRLKLFRKYGLVNGLSTARGRESAIYVPAYHAVFAPPNPHGIIIQHENWHGLRYCIDPSQSKSFQLFMTSLTRFSKQELAATPEEVLIYRCFDEGLANWGAIATAIALPQIYPECDVQNMQLDMAYGYRGTSQGENFQQFVAGKQDLLEQGIDLFNQALTLKGGERVYRALEAQKVVENLEYLLGFYFVKTVTRELSKMGLPIQNSLVKLIKNPPLRIDHLKNPISFARGLK